MPTTAAQPYFHQPSLTPISTAMRGTPGGRTSRFQASLWRSKTVVDGIETTRTATRPFSALASSCCALSARPISEPVAMITARGRPRAVIIATGSEIGLALNAQQELAKAENGRVAVRVVSMPSTTVFDRQSEAWKREVLPPGVPRIAVEMGVSDGWWKYGCAAVVGIDTYGESAPAPVLFKHFGFTVDNVVATVRRVLGQREKS